MRDSFLPPTINHDVPDPECALPLVPPGSASLHRSAAIETALVNTIGFGSKNSALVVRRAGAT